MKNLPIQESASIVRISSIGKMATKYLIFGHEAESREKQKTGKS
jgi:hypothetical protein